MPDIGQLIEARNQLDSAIQRYIHETSETPGIVIDWYLVAEAHHDEDGRKLTVAESQTMTGWKREGLLRHVVRVLYSLT